MPMVSTSLVLARPGTPTSSAWPPESTVISACSTTFSWPKITAPIAALAARTCAAVVSACAHDHVFELFEPFARHRHKRHLGRVAASLRYFHIMAIRAEREDHDRGKRAAWREHIRSR